MKKILMIMGIVMVSIIGSIHTDSFAANSGDQQLSPQLTHQQEKKLVLQSEKNLIQHNMQQLLQTLPVKVGTAIQHEVSTSRT
jgi:hypothetical protein